MKKHPLQMLLEKSEGLTQVTNSLTTNRLVAIASEPALLVSNLMATCIMESACLSQTEREEIVNALSIGVETHPRAVFFLGVQYVDD